MRALALLALALPLTFLQEKEEQKPKVPEIGKPAPTIRLNDHTGRAVQVGPGSAERWSVLAFFPKAATPG